MMNDLTKNCICRLTACIFLMLAGMVSSVANPRLEYEFNYLTNRDGLSNCQVNAILEDNNGYVWLGTMSGLDRYDGFRFKNYFYKNIDKSSIPNNSIDDIQQDAGGNLWIHTSVGYCVYTFENESFDRKPEWWLKQNGIYFSPKKIFIDSNKNMWFVEYGKGCWFLNIKTHKTHFFTFKSMGINSPTNEVNAFTEQKGTAVLTFRDGTICRLDGLGKKVLWTNKYLANIHGFTDEGAYTFIDGRNNYWVYSNSNAFVYDAAHKKWYDGMAAFVKAQGIDMPVSNKIFIRDIAKARDGKLWIATDHNGLFVLDYARKKCQQFVKIEGVKGSLPDNCLLKLYIDRRDNVWIGTYKNGIAYYSVSSTKFSTIRLGDICTITQDKAGNFWCGTNDAGIVSYNPKTGQRQTYRQDVTGLKSDIIVCSLTMSDGTMYFGTFNGGMTRYKNGQWKAYYLSPKGLSNQSVWSLAEDKHHRLIVGTLGGGLQVMDPKTETFKTFNIDNSKITCNYINSLSNMPDGNIIIGHSQNFTIFNVDNFKMTNYDTARGGRAFFSPSVNAAIVDSRGIIWTATPAGMTMYDPKTGQMECLNELNGTQGAVGCAIVEDQAKTIWLVSEYMVTHVKLSKDNHNQWDFAMTSYNYMDGLQESQFNYRSAYLTKSGDLIVGGQDGINLIHTKMERNAHRHVKALFSGLVLFDHPLKAGEEYEGKVVLKKALEESDELDLNYKDNAFTIQLSSSDVSVPSRNRFLYRMSGVTDKWIMTASGRPEVTFTNLSPGSYTLQVKVVNGDGTVCDDISELGINVHPPFYLSIWALMVYILLACGAVYLYRKRALDRQKMIFERERMEANIKKDRELNELKLNFFTNVSHELRTPLTLIISPLANMIKKEDNEDKKRKLTLIHRNAEKLLNLVNQILDFRKIEQNSGKLTLTQVEVVEYVENICRSFQLLGNAKIQLIFESTFKKLIMAFDVDKVGKIINNLLSNSYKFTPDGGSVTVSLDVVKDVKIKGIAKDVLRLKVADTGKGISDEDKAHIFDRFFQVNGTEMQPFGGSGIGLNLVKSFADLHGGSASVADNPGGGTVFTIDIPLKQEGSDVEPSFEKVGDNGENAPRGEANTENAQVEVANTQLEKAIKETIDAASDTAPVLDATSDSVASVSDMVSSPISAGDMTQVGSSDRLRVLLVDDSDDFREFMTEILSENYIVEQAVNGKEGWEKLQGDPLPDIILSDVMMPVMDGNDFCRLVKETPRTADIPFVMLTARLATEHKKEGFENGADEYLTKPFDIDLLNLRIRNLVKWARKGSHKAQIATSSDSQANPVGNQGKLDNNQVGQTSLGGANHVGDGSNHEPIDIHSGAEKEELTPEPVEEYVMTETDKKFLNDVDIYIRDNMGDPDTTVESMSAHLFMSRVQLYKRMVSLTGTTPSEYLRAKRIHRSEELLRSGEFTVSEIAYKVGFNNPRYFSKYFQDEYGMTPSQYKKMHLR